jgi:hypothetical protein
MLCMKPLLYLVPLLLALSAQPVLAQKKSVDTRIEQKKKAPAENPSSASARGKVKENTRASLSKLKGDVKRK